MVSNLEDLMIQCQEDSHQGIEGRQNDSDRLHQNQNQQLNRKNLKIQKLSQNRRKILSQMTSW